MTASCLALISGKLDSVLAARVVQEQGIQIEAIYLKTPFNAGAEHAERAAGALGAPLHVVRAGDDYLALVRDPRFGYTAGASPCLDCRIHMFQAARRQMQERGADFLVSGEVLGQRRHSQRRRDLEVIAYHAGVEDLLLRPLSARLLAPTRAERSGLVDRERLFGFHGHGRRKLFELARQLGLPELPVGGECCALARSVLAERVFELIRQQPDASVWHYELLRVGRHFSLGGQKKVVVGRRAEENAKLAELHRRADAAESALLEPEGFVGPSALLIGSSDDAAIQAAIELLLQCTKRGPREDARIRATLRDAHGVGESFSAIRATTSLQVLRKKTPNSLH